MNSSPSIGNSIFWKGQRRISIVESGYPIRAYLMLLPGAASILPSVMLTQIFSQWLFSLSISSVAHSTTVFLYTALLTTQVTISLRTQHWNQQLPFFHLCRTIQEIGREQVPFWGSMSHPRLTAVRRYLCSTQLYVVFIVPLHCLAHWEWQVKL